MEEVNSKTPESSTEQAPGDEVQTIIATQMVDAILILCLLIVWGAACYMFYHEWSSFHLQLPNRYTSYHNIPKGLEHIKVIKRGQDSVIYRNHNRSMSKWLAERKKKLALTRVSTSPALGQSTLLTELSETGGGKERKRRATINSVIADCKPITSYI